MVESRSKLFNRSQKFDKFVSDKNILLHTGTYMYEKKVVNNHNYIFSYVLVLVEVVLIIMEAEGPNIPY